MTKIEYRTVTVPAYAHFDAETLHEARMCRGLVTSGLCRTVEEAQKRIEAYQRGEMPDTEAPDGQANTREMMLALTRANGIRDAGRCQHAIEVALKFGIHTGFWAIASRYLVAGWV